MKKKIIKWILVVLWMSIIFYFSNFNSKESTNQSRSIIDKSIVEIYKEKNNVNDYVALEKVDIIVRKIAHIIEYLVLVILVCILISEYCKQLNKTLIISFIISILYSISDEIHQYFVIGRSCEIRDIIIDSIGIIIGLFLFKIIKRSNYDKRCII